jgi:hypothetical protein
MTASFSIRLLFAFTCAIPVANAFRTMIWSRADICRGYFYAKPAAPDRCTLFSYLESLSRNNRTGDDERSEKTVVSSDTITDDSEGRFAAWGGTSNGGESEIYQDHYGRTITSQRPKYSTSQTRPAKQSSSCWTQNCSHSDHSPNGGHQQGHSLQYDPMAAAAADFAAHSALQQPPSSDCGDNNQQAGTSYSSPSRRKSSIMSLDEVAVHDSPFYAVGKDKLQDVGRLQVIPKDKNSALYRRSPQFDFARESDKYLKFSSQRVGHDRLEPVVRSNPRSPQLQAPSNNLGESPLTTSSVMEECKPNTMFQSHNQANVLNARAKTQKPRIEMDHLNDVISSPSPFRFLGQPNPNFVVEDISYVRPKHVDSA